MKKNQAFKFGLNNHVIDLIQKVFSNYSQVEKVIIYGSRAKGSYKNGSDIDLTLIGNNIDLNILNQISLDLDDLLLPYTFDLSIYRFIDNPDMISHIQRVGKQFYG
jgi:predicted nucleotidyltransferase